MSLADTASKLLRANGEAVTIALPDAAPAFDPITGEPQAAGTPTELSGFGYPSAYRASEIDGTVVQAGDTKLILELLTARPVVNAIATVDGQDWRIMAVQPIRKSGADVLYICQLRRN